MHRLERHALGSKASHQSGNKELQIQPPRHSHIRQAIGSDSELVAPLVVTAVRVKEKLQPRTSLKGHFLETNKKVYGQTDLRRQYFSNNHVLHDSKNLSLKLVILTIRSHYPHQSY